MVDVALLTERNAAFCLADSPARKQPVWRTANWGYLRMHEGAATPSPCYGRGALRSWALDPRAASRRKDKVGAHR